MLACMACGGVWTYVMGSHKPRRFGGPRLCDDCEWAVTTCQNCHGWDNKHLAYCPEADPNDNLDSVYWARKKWRIYG